LRLVSDTTRCHHKTKSNAVRVDHGDALKFSDFECDASASESDEAEETSSECSDMDIEGILDQDAFCDFEEDGEGEGVVMDSTEGGCCTDSTQSHLVGMFWPIHHLGQHRRRSYQLLPFTTCREPSIVLPTSSKGVLQLLP